MSVWINIGIIIVGTIVFMKLSDWMFGRVFKGQRIHMKFLRGFVKAIILVLGIVILGRQFETTKDIASILLQNTALLVAVLGFAAQQTLNDILGGFMLSWYKPFDIGSRIHVMSQNISGIVENITLRHTVIRCFDNNRIIIPNSIINKEILKNSDYEDSVIGNFMELTVSANSDVHRAISLLGEIIRSTPGVITNEKYNPGILVKDLVKNGYVLKATVWAKTVDDNFAACSEVRIMIHERFREDGIELL